MRVLADNFQPKPCEQGCFWPPVETDLEPKKTEASIVWSFSVNRLFRKCQRQWFYKTKVANALAKKDPVRREAYILSKLGSIHSWRGRLVDQVIEKSIIPSFQMRRQPRLATVLEEARARFDRQLRFGLEHRLRDPGFKAKEHEDDLAAFFGMEYGNPPIESEIQQAWQEVETALTNLIESPRFEEIRTSLMAASQMTAQCTIMFPHAGATVRAVPDLICFFPQEPPIIIDWKVHHFGVHDYYAQLVCYALALTRCGPHGLLPPALKAYPAHDVRLIEAQLLTAEVRHHTISEDDVLNVEDKMAADINEMLLAVDDRENSELTADDFPKARHMGVCDTCNFRKLCWRNNYE